MKAWFFALALVVAGELGGVGAAGAQLALVDHWFDAGDVSDSQSVALELRQVVTLGGGGAETTASFPVSNTAATEVSAAGVTPTSWQCNNATATSVYRVNAGATTITDGIGPYCTTCALGQLITVPAQKLYLLASGGTPTLQCSRVDGAPFSSPGGMSVGFANSTYLRLDAQNDPLTGQLDVAAGTSVGAPSISSNGDLWLSAGGGSGGRGLFVSSSSASSFDAGVTIFGSSAASSNRSSVLVSTAVTSQPDRYPLRVQASGATDVFKVAGNGQSYFGLGAAATPSVTFDGDGDTGMYRQAANEIAFATSGIERAEFWNAGLLMNVAGSGASPSIALLTDQNTGLLWPSADDLGFSAGGTQRMDLSTTALTSSVPHLGFNGVASTPSYSFSADPNTGMYEIAADSLGFSTGGTLALAIGSSQAVDFFGFLGGSALGNHPPVADAVSGYNMMQEVAGSPAVGDCDAAGETGRYVWNSVAHQLNVCEGTGGWKIAAFDAVESSGVDDGSGDDESTRRDVIECALLFLCGVALRRRA